MPKLTDTQIRLAKPRDRAYKIFDADGLYLQVSPQGGKWWRFKYRWGGKEKLLSLGTYPAITLAVARERRDAARKQLAHGIDPSEARQSAKQAAHAADNFEAVAREWHGRARQAWTEQYAERVLRLLEADVFPWLGTRPVAELKSADVLEPVRLIEQRGALETAHRALQICGGVIRYAIATGRAEVDVTAPLRGGGRSGSGALAPVTAVHHAAITNPADVARLVRAIAGYRGSPITRCALRLLPLVFVRPGELRHAEWAEIDLDAAEWSIPAGKMKMRVAHLVPLSAAAVAILRELEPLTRTAEYVFPGVRDRERPMSENTIAAALRGMGFRQDEMSAHGFRAMARTILDEVLGFRPDLIEHQLAHTVRDPLGRAYNRTAHLEGRRAMMETWSRYLELLASPGIAPEDAKRLALASTTS